MEEKHEWVKDLEADDAAWMANLPWTISLPSHGITVVHAGLVPEVAPLSQTCCAVLLEGF